MCSKKYDDRDDRNDSIIRGAHPLATLDTEYRDKTLLEVKVLRQFMAESVKELDAAQETVKELRAKNRRLLGELKNLSRREQKARRQANYDELTGLPNRSLLMDRLCQAVNRAERNSGARLAVLFIDLNGFKAVNDNFGHRFGDVLLKEVAVRLRQCLRAMDTACRYGGDEFVVLLPTLERTESVDLIVERIRDYLARPYSVGGHSVRMTVSIGAATYPMQATDPSALIHRADVSMYARKMAMRCGPG